MLNVDRVVSSLDDRKTVSLGVGEDTMSALVVSCGVNMSGDGVTSDVEDVVTIEVCSRDEAVTLTCDEASIVATVDVSAVDKGLAATSDVSSLDSVPGNEDLDKSMLSERDDSLLPLKYRVKTVCIEAGVIVGSETTAMLRDDCNTGLIKDIVIN